jgi:hypothetical protein
MEIGVCMRFAIGWGRAKKRNLQLGSGIKCACSEGANIKIDRQDVI